MSNDETIRSWKGQEPGAGAPKEEQKAPESPVGDGALKDDELENVAGGEAEMGTMKILTLGCCPDPFAF